MYIRTKDGVYEVEGRKFYDALKRKHYITTKGLAIKEDDIINQSENLEELCDCFVIDDKRNNERYLMDYDDVIKVIYCGGIYEEDVVYGAIWTDKGLIYVAKMNEKGELELK